MIQETLEVYSSLLDGKIGAVSQTSVETSFSMSQIIGLPFLVLTVCGSQIFLLLSASWYLGLRSYGNGPQVFLLPLY